MHKSSYGPCMLGNRNLRIVIGYSSRRVFSATSRLGQNSSWLFQLFVRGLQRCINIRNPVQLAGPGCIVQIDEFLFPHKPKYHRGRTPTNEI